MTEKPFDVLTMGRVSMDLFSQDIGAPFETISGFDTSVGGTPTNVAIGTSRLGLKSALFTAVADDRIGLFVRRYLKDEGVETGFVLEKAGTRTGLAILGVQPPSHFPLTYYRQDPADIHITIADVQQAPIAKSRVLLLTGTAVSRGTCREATFYAAECASVAQVTTFLDLDLRPDQWGEPLAYGVNMRLLLSMVDVVIGTEEEFYAALGDDPYNVMAGDAVTEVQRAQLDRLLPALLAQSARPKVLVLKRGANGVSIFTPQGEVLDIAGFPVDVLNTVGAGDGFASGLIYGYLKGWDWPTCGRFANGNGALVVSRHGCAVAMPYEHELLAFVKERSR